MTDQDDRNQDGDDVASAGAFRQGPRILERARALGVVSSHAKEIGEIAREFGVREERVRKIVACAIEGKRPTHGVERDDTETD